MNNSTDNSYMSPEQAAASANYGASVTPTYPSTYPSTVTSVPLYASSQQNQSSESTQNYRATEYVPSPKSAPPRKFQLDRKKKIWIIVVGVVVLVVAIVLIALFATGTIGPKPITATIFSANTKQNWMNILQDDFNKKGVQIENSGQKAAVLITSGGSNVSTQATLPDGWSPQNYLWVSQLTDQYKANGSVLFASGGNQDCQAIAYSPVGIAMWKPMAEAMGWPNANIGWKDILELAGNATGWSKYQKPWGALRFGHGQPEFSNTGRLTLLAAIYSLTTPTGGITTAEANSPAAAAAIQKLSNAVQHMGTIDTDLLDLMARRGLTYLHAVSTYEANVIQFNINNPSQERLVFIYPSDGTFWSENPLCVLTGDSQKAGALRKFREFALSRDSQVKLVQNGLRPIPSFADISLTNTPGSLFTQSNGVLASKTIENVKQIPYPSSETMQTVINVWKTVKKSSVSLLVIDTSGSMTSRSNGITSIAAVQSAASAYISAMLPQDYLAILQFSGSSKLLTPAGSTGSSTNISTFAITSSWRSNAIKQVNDMLADGNTLLYDSISQASDIMNGFRNADKAANINRNYGIIVMTDGHDTASTKYKSSAALTNSLPDGSESDQVHIFTIGFGDDIDENELKLVANRTNGKYYHGNVVNILSLYQQLSLEF
ncbi:hypothetical protein HK098_005196 [Nowakowskiella sp. JEL0407]|nr:hypothetical protein HK098_005196 [Nowakowskiella sp. JEL0407]